MLPRPAWCWRAARVRHALEVRDVVLHGPVLWIPSRRTEARRPALRGRTRSEIQQQPRERDSAQATGKEVTRGDNRANNVPLRGFSGSMSMLGLRGHRRHSRTTPPPEESAKASVCLVSRDNARPRSLAMQFCDSSTQGCGDGPSRVRLAWELATAEGSRKPLSCSKRHFSDGKWHIPNRACDGPQKV